MSFNGLNFTYNGKLSEDYGFQIVHLGSENITQSLSSTRTVVREHVRFKQNFYYGADKSNYNFSIKVARLTGDGEFTSEDRFELLRFFCDDGNLHAFTCEEEFPSIEFWVQITKIEFVSFRQNVGYFQLEFESNDPYPFSSMQYEEYDLSENTGTQIINIINNSNTSLYFTPNIMEFTLVGTTTNFTLKNLTNAGKQLTFTGLSLLETIAINSNQEILSSTNNECISKFNFGFNAIELCYGINRLEITGKCILKFKMQFPMQI